MSLWPGRHRPLPADAGSRRRGRPDRPPRAPCRCLLEAGSTLPASSTSPARRAACHGSESTARPPPPSMPPPRAAGGDGAPPRRRRHRSAISFAAVARPSFPLEKAFHEARRQPAGDEVRIAEAPPGEGDGGGDAIGDGEVERSGGAGGG